VLLFIATFGKHFSAFSALLTISTDKFIDRVLNLFVSLDIVLLLSYLNAYFLKIAKFGSFQTPSHFQRLGTKSARRITGQGLNTAKKTNNYA
jgi:hypothetical protein